MGGESGELPLHGYRVWVWADNRAPIRMVAMVVQQCEYSNAPELCTKMVTGVSFLLYIC